MPKRSPTAEIKVMVAVCKGMLGQYASNNAPYMVAIRWPTEARKGLYYMPVSNHATRESAKKKAIRVQEAMRRKGWEGKVVIKRFFNRGEDGA